ncbi:P-loop containing nucleoside triphosphate hydrolase protein [Lactifluus subvellereus]|nr:P-loop containing nucleoside triphosphate hydrolase protein [Lactifluus subvellereus]
MSNAQASTGENDIAFMAFLLYHHIVVHVPSSHPSRSRSSPLFVALQGPQGSGKTVVTECLRTLLTDNTNEQYGPFNVATLSIDDLYLPHAQLKALASAHPENPLLQGRGHPGTHDIALGLSLLRSLKEINRSPTNNLRIPRFDKSLVDGEGDRLPESEWTLIHGPIDIVLLEGWCVGFHPQSLQYIEQRINEAPSGLDGMFDCSAYSLEHILDVNQRLAEYVKWWDLFDICAQISPPGLSPYMPIYKWRLQQEHEMKAKNNGQGMTDEQVKLFVDRYIPGYHFFGASIVAGGYDEQTGLRLSPPWMKDEDEIRLQEIARCLRVNIDGNRRVKGVEYGRR